MPSTLIKRLQKLIDHANSASVIGSNAEAEAFATKVQQLMLSHNVTISELGYDPQEWREPLKDEWAASASICIDSSSQSPRWQEVFSTAIADEHQFHNS